MELSAASTVRRLATAIRAAGATRPLHGRRTAPPSSALSPEQNVVLMPRAARAATISACRGHPHTNASHENNVMARMWPRSAPTVSTVASDAPREEPPPPTRSEQLLA